MNGQMCICKYRHAHSSKSGAHEFELNLNLLVLSPLYIGMRISEYQNIFTLITQTFLQGFTLLSKRLSSQFECNTVCFLTPGCNSYNFITIPGEFARCELKSTRVPCSSKFDEAFFSFILFHQGNDIYYGRGSK